ncbi:MAG: hypothetical protein WA047_10945 [Phenylobacterium sp.]|uniref:hypothetical protein n=1 Tax=Phenylobacterium sp. TaxID=1871053 RepID=UPI003BB4CA35
MDDGVALRAETSRSAVRLSTIYFLEMVRLVMPLTDGDLMAAVVLLAISEANVRRLTGDPIVTARFEGLHDIPPDEFREPVSVFAIAKSLGLPYETARRHCNGLISKGFCTRQAGGLVVPASVYAREDFKAATAANWRQAQVFAEQLLNLGSVCRGVG